MIELLAQFLKEENRSNSSFEFPVEYGEYSVYLADRLLLEDISVKTKAQIIIANYLAKALYYTPDKKKDDFVHAIFKVFCTLNQMPGAVIDHYLVDVLSQSLWVNRPKKNDDLHRLIFQKL
jgi:hypothetical protein